MLALKNILRPDYFDMHFLFWPEFIALLLKFDHKNCPYIVLIIFYKYFLYGFFR